jgi:hypothetical protein
MPPIAPLNKIAAIFPIVEIVNSTFKIKKEIISETTIKIIAQISPYTIPFSFVSKDKIAAPRNTAIQPISVVIVANDILGSIPIFVITKEIIESKQAVIIVIQIKDNDIAFIFFIKNNLTTHFD